MELSPPMRVLQAFMHRGLLICAVCSALLAAATLAAGQNGPNGAACVAGAEAAPERVIEDCDALLTDKAIADDRVPGIFLARAEAFVRQGRLKLAIDDLGNVINRRPDNTHAFLRRAELQRGLGDAEAAIRDFSSAIRLEPNNTTALFARAELYRVKTDRRRALADYAAVLRIDPSHAAASASHKTLAQEIERSGAMMPIQPAQQR
jgi:tetratricopeptide (TPR) repeat protein